jgi:hypothetical protein
MNSELGNSSYCFKQAWNEGGKVKFSIVECNGTTVYGTLEDNSSVMQGPNQMRSFIYIPPYYGIPIRQEH